MLSTAAVAGFLQVLGFMHNHFGFWAGPDVSSDHVHVVAV